MPAAVQHILQGDAWEPAQPQSGPGIPWPDLPGLGNSKSNVSGRRGRGAKISSRAGDNPRRLRQLRKLFFALRRVAQDLTDAKGLQRCGRVRLMAGRYDQGVEIRQEAGGRAFFAGLLRCGSPWECPVCMQGIQAGRAEEVLALGRKHRDQGGELYMLTLTLPHSYGDALGPLRKRVSEAWRRTQSGRAWKALKGEIGLVGTVRALEVTVGPNGWHPHLHVLLLVRRELPAAVEANLLTYLKARWGQEITRGKDWKLPSQAHGVTLRRAYRETYVAKLAAELVRGGRKRGRAHDGQEPGNHRTPLELLEDVGRGHRPQDVALWLEYSREMRGARQLTYSQVPDPRNPGKRVSLLKLYDLTEQTDLDLAGGEERRPAVVRYVIEPQVWDDVVKHDLRLQVRLLRIVEEHPPGDHADAIVKAIWAASGETVPPF